MMVSDRYPKILFSYHDSHTVSSRAVRDILVKQVGLSEDEALVVLRNRG